MENREGGNSPERMLSELEALEGVVLPVEVRKMALELAPGGTLNLAEHMTLKPGEHMEITRSADGGFTVTRGQYEPGEEKSQ